MLLSNESSTSPAEAAARIRALLKDKPKDVRSDVARLDELRRILASFLEDRILPNRGGRGGGRGDDQDALSAVKKWRQFLKKSHATLVEQLCCRVSHVSFVRIFLGVIATSPSLVHGRGVEDRGRRKIDSELLTKFFVALIQCGSKAFESMPIRTMLTTEFLKPYRDVQYYSMTAIAAIAEQRAAGSADGGDDDNDDTGSIETSDWLVELLKMIPLADSEQELRASRKSSSSSDSCLFPHNQNVAASEAEDDDESSSQSDEDKEEEEEGDDDDNNDESKQKSQGKDAKLVSYFDYRAHRSAWTKAWLAVLKLQHSNATLRDALTFLPLSVLPVSTQPLRFSDFFMKAYGHNDSPVISLLALDGLFVLITIHGLEYPAFYKQLYKLVNSPFLYLKHRLHFCRLLDKCLNRNEMLPAHIVAAFCKRLLRRCLTAPPASCLFIIALISNLLRNHPEASCLIHRDTDSLINDTFDALTDDPEKANALGSSLWELESLERHYYPAVVTLAKSVGRDLNAPKHDLEEFLNVTYNTLFEEERGKRKRQETALAFKKPTKLFSRDDLFGSIISRPDESL
jgi:CBF/Mak21 family